MLFIIKRNCTWMSHVIIVSISNLSRTYASGYQALKKVKPEIQAGEILALFGPNRAGKQHADDALWRNEMPSVDRQGPGARADCGHGHGITQGNVDPGTAVACLEGDDYSHYLLYLYREVSTDQNI